MYLTPVFGPSIISPAVITWCDDYGDGARGGEWGVDEVRCNRAYTNRLKVETTSKYTGPLQIMASIGAHIGDTYRFPYSASTPTETDTGSFLQKIRADLASEDGLQWSVTLEYAPFDVVHQLGVTDISQGIVNPTDRNPEVWWDYAKYERFKVEDETPDTADPPGPLPYRNTVGDPLLDPPPTEETRPVLFIARNEPVFNDAYAAQFKDTVNSGEFLGYPPNTVKCRNIKSERFYDPDWGYFFKVTYEFEIRDDDDGNGYTHLSLNAGYRQKVNGTGNPVNVTDANGQQVTDAVPLQKDGSYQPTADPYYLEFQQFPQIDFSQLNIPDGILQLNS